MRGSQHDDPPRDARQLPSGVILERGVAGARSHLRAVHQRPYLAGLEQETANAYRSIVNNAYLSAYRKTLRILIGAITAMILVMLVAGLIAVRRYV